jgi:RND superfamily putative drug exporter
MGRWSATHRKTAIIGWFTFVVVSVMLGGAIGIQTIDDKDRYTGDSARAEQVMREHGLELPAGEVVLIESAKLEASDPQFRRAVNDVQKRLDGVPAVKNLRTPADAPGLVAQDGHAALVQFDITGPAEDAVDKVEPMLAATTAAQKANPQVQIAQTGDASVVDAIQQNFADDLAKSRNLTVGVTAIVLLIAFGAIVAAGIPVLLAITAVMATIGLVAIPSQLLPVDEAGAEVILLVGMAVGVDYSLFYLRRQREERARGLDTTAAIEAAAATSGRAVLISGLTVIVAMSGMFLTGNLVFKSFGIGTIMVVAVAMIGSLTVLPAMLAALGDKVEKGRLPLHRLVPRRRRERSGNDPQQPRFWGPVVDAVLRRPGVYAVAATALLVTLAAPALSMQTRDSGISDFPEKLAPVAAFERLQASFPSQNETAQVVVRAADVRAPEVRGAIKQFNAAVAQAPGLHAPQAVRYSSDGRVAEIMVPLDGSDNQAVAQRGVEQLRETVIPSTLSGVPGVEAHVTGYAASSKDFNDQMSRNAPYVFAFVLSLAFMLMLISFHSIVIALKAIVLNLLSVAAAYGVLVVTFQRGWGESLLGFESNGAIASWLPLFLFVILFGLSMDYHVFILSRIREAYDRGLSTDDAIANGIKSTAGVVTSAAVVMVGVFLVFATLSSLEIKQMGVGLAAAVLIDATIIRAVLLPATMKLLGEWNWYMPKSLAWLPSLQLEAPAAEPEPARG